MDKWYDKTGIEIRLGDIVKCPKSKDPKSKQTHEVIGPIAALYVGHSTDKMVEVGFTTISVNRANALSIEARNSEAHINPTSYFYIAKDVELIARGKLD